MPEETGADYLKAAVELAEKLNERLGTSLRVCVHTTNSPVMAGELADCLRLGDIFCHCYQGAGNPICLENGSMDPGVLSARSRGALADIAIFEEKEKHYIQKDYCDDELECSRILVPQMTMIAGEIQYCRSDFYL